MSVDQVRVHIVSRSRAWSTDLAAFLADEVRRRHPDAEVMLAVEEDAEPADGVLTGKERAVLELMRQHLTDKEIAQQMGISWHTVRSHARSILRKHGVHSRREIAVRGLRGDVAPPPLIQIAPPLNGGAAEPSPKLPRG